MVSSGAQTGCRASPVLLRREYLSTTMGDDGPGTPSTGMFNSGELVYAYGAAWTRREYCRCFLALYTRHYFLKHFP